MREILFAAISMFIFKQPSRNHFNMNRKRWQAAVQKLFGIRIPHLDTVDDVLKDVDPEELEQLQATLVRTLIERKTFKSGRIFGKYYLVAVDMTGVMTVAVGEEGSTTKESKNGVQTASRQVLEVKLITIQGFAISLASEWVRSDQVNTSKEDCELNAFKRVAERLKILFPKLPMCLLVDGLYPSEPFIKICEEKKWKFIAVLKDGKLKTVWNAVDAPLFKNDTNSAGKNLISVENGTLEWVVGIIYRTFEISWLRLSETDKKGIDHCFAWITNMECYLDTIASIASAGRQRWGIEDSFNTQKNRGYNLGHKFSRVSFTAIKNYYTLCQLGHMICQLLELSQYASSVRINSKITLEKMWSLITECLSWAYSEICNLTTKKIQLRYVLRS